MTLGSTVVAAYALVLVATGFRALPGDIAANSALAPWGLYVHIAASAIALLVGPWQFRASLRRKHPRLHRILGRVYVTSCLVGGTAGGAIALGTTHGPVAGTGFLLLALSWVAATSVAFARIRASDVDGHRRWMVRSFALTFAAVTLRLYLGIGAAAGADYDAIYPAIAWLCWVPNLLLALWWTRPDRSGRPMPVRYPERSR